MPKKIGLADACNSEILIQHDNDLRKALGKVLKVQVLKDSETLTSVIISKASTTGKRIMIDVKADKEAYNDGIIDNIIRIRRKLNLADVMTKTTILP